MDWWELFVTTLSGSSCQLCRRTHNAVRACRLLLHQVLQPVPTCIIPGWWTASAAPHMARLLFTALYRRLKWCRKCTVTERQSGSSHVPVASSINPQHRLKKTIRPTTGQVAVHDRITGRTSPKTSQWFSCCRSGWSSGARMYLHTL